MEIWFKILMTAVFVIAGFVYFITSYIWNKDPLTKRVPRVWWLVGLGIAQFMIGFGVSAMYFPKIASNTWIAVPSAVVAIICFVIWCCRAVTK